MYPGLPLKKGQVYQTVHKMIHANAKDFFPEVYEIVRQIPEGKVMTYGRIARLLGRPQNSRLVGQALQNVPDNLCLPCHRVVNSQGRTAPGWEEQKSLLAAEGVGIKPNGCIDLKKYLWDLI